MDAEDELVYYTPSVTSAVLCQLRGSFDVFSSVCNRPKAEYNTTAKFNSK